MNALEPLQNLKKALEGYIAHLEEHALNVAKGHILAAQHTQVHVDFGKRSAEMALELLAKQAAKKDPK